MHGAAYDAFCKFSYYRRKLCEISFMSAVYVQCTFIMTLKIKTNFLMDETDICLY